MARNNIRVAAVQPRAYWGEEEWRNVEGALAYLEEAVRAGAQLVTFPEAYPGPGHGPLDSGGHLSISPIEAIQDAARKHGVYVAAGNLEEHPEVSGAFYLTLKLISPTGEILANYRRVQPDGEVLNAYLHGGRAHILPGDEIMVVETEIGRIGLQICAELWVPEISRVQMLMGAEIIIAPVNGQHTLTRSRVKDTWRCVARARAAENQLYVILSQNIFTDQTRGMGIIAGPEDTLAMSDEATVLVADLDLERIRWLRTRYFNEEVLQPPNGDTPLARCRLGQIHERRPELYRLLAEPHEDAYDYFYYRRGLEASRTEMERVRNYPRPVVPGAKKREVL